jgi:hypothetical protein
VAPPLPEKRLPEVREPTSVACRVRDFSGSVEKLRLRAGGPVFATLVRAPVSLALPTGAPAPATAVMDEGLLVVRGVIDTADVRLYLRQPTVFRGFLLPKARTLLTWAKGNAGTLTLSVSAKSVLVDPGIVEDLIPCEKLALTPQSFEARDVVTKRTGLSELGVARDAAPLSGAPGGEVLAELRAATLVKVVETKGNATRILIDQPGYYAFGWVRSADLAKPTHLAGYGTGYGRSSRTRGTIRGGRVCLRDLTLIAEVSGERALVGTVRKGMFFDLDEPEPEEPADGPPPRGRRARQTHVPIQLPRARWLRVAEGAHLLVPADELAECDPPTAE